MYSIHDAPQRSALPWLLLLLMTVGSATGGLWANEEREKLLKKIGEANDRALASEKQIDRMKSGQQALSEKAQMEGAKRKEIEALVKELQGKVQKSGDVAVENNKITVNLIDQVLFKSGEADLSPKGLTLLTNLGATLKELKEQNVVIGGHTDRVPIHNEKFPSNWELSAARALTVVHFLQTAGVEPQRLAASAYSEFHPRSRKDERKDRRIEILLTPTVEVKKTQLASR